MSTDPKGCRSGPSRGSGLLLMGRTPGGKGRVRGGKLERGTEEEQGLRLLLQSIQSNDFACLGGRGGGWIDLLKAFFFDLTEGGRGAKYGERGLRT